MGSESPAPCCCGAASGSVSQTLAEMEFERGPWQAAIDGDIERLSMLVKKYDSTVLSWPDSAGYFPLHYAARHKRSKVVDFLVLHGVDPNATTSGKTTALHRAAYVGDVGIVEVLLGAGADPLLVDQDGDTALHKAHNANKHDVCRVLTRFAPELINVKNNKQLLLYDIEYQCSN